VLHFSSLSLHAYMIKSVEHGGAWWDGWMDKLGTIDLSSVRGGRIECTMQNVADQLVTRQPSRLTSESHGMHKVHSFGV
jgi:hypothetical protein